MRITSLAVLVLATSIAAQEAANEPRFRIALAASVGNFDFSGDTGGIGDDDTDAGLFRLSFEYISRSRLGGGVRLESYVTDDDLFAAGPSGAEARNGSLFGHFTYRLGGDRFEMPLRAGLLASTLTVESNGSGTENEAASFGPYVELAPELTLIKIGPTRWTVYGEFGVGYTATQIDSDALANDFDSTSLFYGAEIGTRLGLGMFEVGLGYLARFQTTDESDAEAGVTFPDFDTTFQGIMLSAALRF